MERIEIGMKNKRQELLDKKKLLEEEIQKIDSELKQFDYQNKDDFDKSESGIESEKIIYCSKGTNQKLFKSRKGHDSFKVFDIDGNTAKFEYCGDPINTDYFNNVASFTNNPYDIPNREKISTIEPGIVEKDENNEWVIIKPVKIKFS